MQNVKKPPLVRLHISNEEEPFVICYYICFELYVLCFCTALILQFCWLPLRISKAEAIFISFTDTN